jgi:hypothetical protein
MANAALYELTALRANRGLGAPQPWRQGSRPASYVVGRITPTRATTPIDRGTDFRGRAWSSAAYYGGGMGWRLGSLGQPGAQITLPDGQTHTVQDVNTTGEILTTDGWQSATQTDGTERWVNVHTGDVMLSTGEIVKALGSSGMLTSLEALPWKWIGGGVVAASVLLYLASAGAPVVGRRLRSAGRGAWAGYRS